MRTSNKRERQREVWRVFARALVFVFLWVPEEVTGNCAESAFNLSAFSPETMTLVSRSWIDSGGSLRMAPPDPINMTSTNNTAIAGGQNAMGMGQALYKTPLSLVDPRTNNSLSFSTFFSFSLISVRHPASNGMAFLITPDQSNVQENSAGGSPLFDPNNVVLWNSSGHTFAVQLEKWDDMRPPGPNKTNVINVNPSATHTYNTYLEDAAMNFAWIEYDAMRLHLQVSVSNTSEGPKWTLLSTACDLSTVFGNPMYIGFYSRDKVSIRSWSFNSTCLAVLPALNITPPVINPPALIPNNADNGSTNFNDTVNEPPEPIDHSWLSRNRLLLIYIGAGSGCTFLVCFLVVVFVRCIWLFAMYRGAKSIPDDDLPFTPQIFSYRTLSMATNGFDERALLGRGGFGGVYKGLIAEDECATLVAVKRIESRNDAQRERQFIAEVRKSMLFRSKRESACCH